MPHVQHSGYALQAYLTSRVINSWASGRVVGCGSDVLTQLAAMRDDFLLNEIPESSDTARLPQLFGIGKENRDFAALFIGQNPHGPGEILDHVMRQNADAEIVDHRLKHTEIVVHVERRFHVIGQQTLNKDLTGTYLGRIGPLTDQPVVFQIIQRLGVV